MYKLRFGTNVIGGDCSSSALVHFILQKYGYILAKYLLPPPCSMLGYERTITRTNNWPFPRPLYQNEVKCSAFDMEMIFHSHANKSHFHKKSCVLGFILRVRVFGLLQCDYNNQSQFNYNIHLVRCNFFKLLKVGLPLGKMFLKLSISFTNYAVFHEKLRFEVNYAKSQHRRMSEALHKRWGHLMLFPSSFETRELFR